MTTTTTTTDDLENRKYMVKKALFLTFGSVIIGFYLISSWFGWELANSGSNSRLGTPIIFGGGYRGGK